MTRLVINSKIIKDYLKENDFTIKKFCEVYNIKYYNYRQITKNDLNVRSKVLYKVCKTINVKLANFIIVQKV